MSISLLFVAIGLFNTPSAHAAQTVPYKVNFQGRLTDASGNAKAAGSYNIKFRLMSASSGGSNLWQADRVRGASDYRVTVTTGGLFNVQLGDTTLGDPALSPSIFNTQTNATVYLEVELPTPATATCSTNGCASFTEGAMTPRSLLASAAYAFNADTVDGIDGASLAQLGSNNTFTGTFLHKNASNSTTAFQIQESGGEALFVADTTNMAIKVGGGDVSPDASPTLFVLDYKNTSGDPTGTNGAMYYNSNTNTFRCYEDSTWKDCVEGLSTRELLRYDNDFSGIYNGGSGFTNATGSIDGMLVLTSAGSSATIGASLASEASHPGILRMSLSNSATVASAMTLAQGIHSASSVWSFNGQARVTTLSDASHTYHFRLGFSYPVGTQEPTDGCYMKYLHSVNSGKWQGVCRSANTESTCDTGVTVAAATWYDVNVVMNTDSGVATFTINDTNSCTVSTNLPSTSMSFSANMWKTTGSFTARTVDVDFMSVRGRSLGR